MTLRAFLIGLLGVVGLALLAPVNDYVHGNTYLTGSHFPVGVFFFLLVLTLLVNLVLRAVRRGWALAHGELMLVAVMMLVASTVPASGLMRYLFPLATTPAHLSQRSDIYWEETVLRYAPEGVLLSTNPRSVAVEKFFDGTPPNEAVRVPWERWAGVFFTWGSFLAFYYLGTIFLCSILRRQWVENERLTFPVARFALETTEPAEHALLPAMFRNRAFVVGVSMSLFFGLMRLLPVLFGADEGWLPQLPVRRFIEGTVLENTPLRDGRIFPVAIGFAFLVPAEVSLSMWLFYMLTVLEVVAIQEMGLPIRGGANEFIRWQQAGAFIVFTVGVLWMARRHVSGVIRHALRWGGEDDSDEPIPNAVSFWGLVACVVGAFAWYRHFGINLWVAGLLLGLMLSIVVVHARLVTQGGLILTGHAWSPSVVLHGLLGNAAFSPAAAVVVQMQNAVLLADAREILSPHMMNAFRISSVWHRRRRWFLLAVVAALVTALVAGTYSSLRWVYYGQGASNLQSTYAIGWHSLSCYNTAHEIIRGSGPAEVHAVALVMGGAVMAALQALRWLFYWWPVNPLGFLVSASWAIRPMWVSFLIGWVVKAGILNFGSGGVLRSVRSFFLGVIASEVVLIGLTTAYTLLTGVRFGWLFMPS